MSTKTIPSWTFGDRIRKVRRETGLSQEAFAAKIGVGRQALASWEAGTADNPHDVVSVARAVEAAFGFPAAWMLGLVGSDLTRRYGLALGA